MSVKYALQVRPTLKKLASVRQKAKRKAILSKCNCKVFSVLSDIAKNILKGKIKVQPNELKKLQMYKRDLRTIAKQRDSKKIRKVLIQKGGFLPILIKPALSLLASVVASKLMKQ